MNHDPNQNQQMPYQAPPPYVETGAVMSVKDWIVTLLLCSIPCVGLVMLFIWAFSGNTNPNKQNFARGYLIFTAVVLVLYMFMWLILGVAMAGILSELSYYF